MTGMSKQIIAMGGGGFSMEPKNLALDAYVVAQARTSSPRVLFVPTASGDSEPYIARFYAAFSGLECRPQHLPLFKTQSGTRDAIVEHDVIYVGGGNTKSMLGMRQARNLSPSCPLKRQPSVRVIARRVAQRNAAKGTFAGEGVEGGPKGPRGASPLVNPSARQLLVRRTTPRIISERALRT